MHFQNLFLTNSKTAAILLAGIITVMPLQQSIAGERKEATISVSGTGTAAVAPDMAIVSFGVLREGKTAREALSANNKAMNDVLTAMRDKGIADKDLQTSNFNISPRYHYPKRNSNGEQPPPQIIGYTVSNHLDVRVRDLSQTGEILDLVVSLGVNTGGNIRFTNDDKRSVLKKARIAAVKDAVEKAETLVTAAGVELGDIMTISENFTTPRPQSIARAKFASAEAADSVPIASGENAYQVTVQITWELDQ